MKVKLTKGKVASKVDIETLQRRLGEQLAPEYLEFVVGNDGAIPEVNTFKIGETNNAGVRSFIPVHKIPEEMSDLDLPAKSYPVAEASFGNYIFINQAAGGAVFFWDHEEPEDVVQLAESFHSFLHMLEPLDISAVTLKPGQAKVLYADPEFVKEMQRQGLIAKDKRY